MLFADDTKTYLTDTFSSNAYVEMFFKHVCSNISNLFFFNLKRNLLKQHQCPKSIIGKTNNKRRSLKIQIINWRPKVDKNKLKFSNIVSSTKRDIVRDNES